MAFINNLVTGEWHMCVDSVLQTSLASGLSVFFFFLCDITINHESIPAPLMKSPPPPLDYSWDEDLSESLLGHVNSPPANLVKESRKTETTHPFSRLLQKSLTYKGRPRCTLRYRSFCVAKEVSRRWYHRFVPRKVREKVRERTMKLAI